MALGLLLLWAFPLTGQLWMLLPLIMATSLTWAASDISVRSKLQNSLPANKRGRAMGFVNAMTFLLTLGANLGLGALFDAFPSLQVFGGVAAAVTALALAAFYAAGRLKG